MTFNTLRLCARRAYTVYELAKIRLRDTPGLPVTVSDKLSEINVTVEVGECERRELLITVGTVPDPLTSGGYTSLLRTTIFAFLLHPALALAEPHAFAQYLQAWTALPQTQAAFAQSSHARFPELSDAERLALYEWEWKMALVFPDYLRSRWMVLHEPLGVELPPELTASERKRVFGEYCLMDLKTVDNMSSDRVHRPRVSRLWSPWRQGIPQHASALIEWLESPARSQLDAALHRLSHWPARSLRWQLRRREQRARPLARRPALNADWIAEAPPREALMPGRFSLCVG